MGCFALIPGAYLHQNDFVNILRTTLTRRLNVDIVYRPDSTPNPFSLLCEAAYCENATTPGPDDDPVGWVTLPNANIHGKLSLFNDRHAHLRCTVSLLHLIAC